MQKQYQQICSLALTTTKLYYFFFNFPCCYLERALCGETNKHYKYSGEEKVFPSKPLRGRAVSPAHSRVSDRPVMCFRLDKVTAQFKYLYRA